jgi:hypothetical protein
LKRELKEPEIGNAEGFGTSQPLWIQLSNPKSRILPNSLFIVGGIRKFGFGGPTSALPDRSGYRRPIGVF